MSASGLAKVFGRVMVPSSPSYSSTLAQPLKTTAYARAPPTPAVYSSPALTQEVAGKNIVEEHMVFRGVPHNEAVVKEVPIPQVDCVEGKIVEALSFASSVSESDGHKIPSLPTLLAEQSSNVGVTTGGVVLHQLRRVPEASSATHVSLSWLALLFWVTLALLVFQVVLGILSGSLALIADSAHSSVDVITYGMNYLVERFKVSVANGSGSSSPTTLQKIDSRSGCLSTLVLIAATSFAINEAIERLKEEVRPQGANDHAEAGTRAGFWGIGAALLAFAVVSTLANVAILVVFQRWHAAAAVASHVSRGEDEEEGRYRPNDSFREMVNPTDHPLVHEIELVPAGVPRGGGTRPPRRGKAKLALGKGYSGLPSPASESSTGALVPGIEELPEGVPGGGATLLPRRGKAKLALCGSYSGLPSPAGQGDESSTGDSSNSLSRCATGCGCGPGGNEASGPSGDSTGASASRGWSSVLHMLVHPGCTGHHDGGGSGVSGDSEAIAGGAVGSSPGLGDGSWNLNLSAAMLHLIADVLRGITMFIVAILLELGVLKDAGKADAICALAVAAFIIVGAAALFKQAFTSICRRSQ